MVSFPCGGSLPTARLSQCFCLTAGHNSTLPHQERMAPRPTHYSPATDVVGWRVRPRMEGRGSYAHQPTGRIHRLCMCRTTCGIRTGSCLTTLPVPYQAQHEGSGNETVQYTIVYLGIHSPALVLVIFPDLKHAQRNYRGAAFAARSRSCGGLIHPYWPASQFANFCEKFGMDPHCKSLR